MAKKQTKKESKVAKKANPVEATINACDAGILVTVKDGNVEVTGIKNIGFAYEAVGLMTSALNTYNIRPIINNQNRNAKIILDKESK